MQTLPKTYLPYVILMGTTFLCLVHFSSTVNQQSISTVPYLVYWIKTIAIWILTLILVVLFPFRFNTRFASVLFFLLITAIKHLALLGLGCTYGYHLTILDFSNTALLVFLLMNKGVPVRWTLLYTLNPLVTICLFTENPNFVFIAIVVGLFVTTFIILGNFQWWGCFLTALLVGIGLLGGVYQALHLGMLWCLLFVIVYPTCLGLLVVTPLLFGAGPIFIAPGIVVPPEPIVEQVLYMLLIIAVISTTVRYCFARYYRARKSCKTISVVIPTFDEQDRIKACIVKAFECELVKEVLVVDGGSSDATIEVAKQSGAKVILHQKLFTDGGGRGGQIRAGILAARGDVIAVVHADTLISSSALMMVVKVLQKDPLLVGGSLGCSFRSTKKTMKIVEFLNDLRAAVFGISFGDQVQFFRRDLVVSKDIFPAIPLMEDVEFCLRQKKFGYHTHLFMPVSCSARRWHKMGGANSVLIVKLFLLYLFKRVFSTPDAVEFYRKYYRK